MKTYVGEALEGQHLGGLLGEGAEAAPLLLEREPRVVPPQEAQGVAHLCFFLILGFGLGVGGVRLSGRVVWKRWNGTWRSCVVGCLGRLR